MAKFKPGDVISYGGRKLRVRQQSFVGFECDAHKPGQFYDLTDVDTGQHLCLPTREIEEGIKEINNGSANYNIGDDPNQVNDQFEEINTGIKADLVEHSDKSYWEQMEGKIEIPEKLRQEFEASVGVQKKVDNFNKPSKLRKLWDKVINRG